MEVRKAAMAMRQDGTLTSIISLLKPTESTGLTPNRYIVCEYHPAGNVLGQFRDNVMKQEGAASSTHVNLLAMGIALAIVFSSVL